MKNIKTQVTGLGKQVLPYVALTIAVAVCIIAIKMDLTSNSKWDAIKFAYTDPQAVMWVKRNLNAKNVNARRETCEELNPGQCGELVPQVATSGAQVSLLSPVSQ